MEPEFEFNFYLRGPAKGVQELEKQKSVVTILEQNKVSIAKFRESAPTLADAIAKAREIVKAVGLETFAITYDESYT